MIRNILIILWLLTSVALANPIDDKCPQHVYKGAPVSPIKSDDQYLCRTNYAVHYRYDTRTAEYVVEHVTKQSVTGPAKRKDDFRADPEIKKEHQSLLSDYNGNPYDRGHLAPAGDNTQNTKVMSESFLLSNMVPQVPNNNRGIWKQLETFVREWTLKGLDIYVVSGTIYSRNSKTIGDNKVGVPDKIWKVIIDKNTGESIAFIFPNTALPVGDLLKYAVSVKQVEDATAIKFMPGLTDEKSKSSFDINRWPDLHLMK
jgi:endonuclease G